MCTLMYFSADKFEQFWFVNRKLMVHSEGEMFRHIPFRIHWVSGVEWLPLVTVLCTEHGNGGCEY